MAPFAGVRLPWSPSERRRAQAVRWAARFAAGHGGATAVLEHLGRPGARIVLVGADGRWSDLVVADLAAARQVCEQGGVEVADGSRRDLRADMHDTGAEWRRMGHPGGG